MEGCDNSISPGHLYVVGTGPGTVDLITPRAQLAIKKSHIIAGYKTYIKLIQELISSDQEIVSSSMMQEVERCKSALDAASSGKAVTLVCSGDPGIYAMAGLVFELCKKAEENGRPYNTEIEIIPGVPALSACAALLGAPLMHDFAAISLSDLLTPWELIEKRLEAAASADFVIVLYNPRSKKRTEQIIYARNIILQYRQPSTPVGIVSAATREDETITLTSLGKMPDHDINMQSTVIIGNSNTFAWNGKMVTPRGYANKYGF